LKRSHVLPALLLCVLPSGAWCESLSTTGLSPVLGRRVAIREELLAQIGGTKKPKGEETPKPAEISDGRVNPRKAMLYSLLVPGLGQQIAGREERARVFYGIEAAIWTSFVAFRLQGDGRKDRYIEFAEFNGDVDASGKNDEFWRLIAQYERSDPGPGSANELIRRQGRALYPDDPEAQKAYFEEHGYFGDMTWDWKNADNLERFRELRSRSLDSYDRAQFSIALALAHRIVSMIDAARMASKSNKAMSEEGSETGSLEPHGRFGMKLARDGHSRFPMLTYKLNF
jgi:hypothetical protein